MKRVKNILLIIIIIFVIAISTACNNDVEEKNNIDHSSSSTTKDDDLDNSEPILEDGKLNIKQMNSYIDSQISYLKTTYGDQLEDYIKYYGFNNEKEFRNYLTFGYISSLETLNYAKGLVSDKEVQKYYDEKVFGEIEASHILIKPSSNDEEAKSIALDKINIIISELNNSSDIKKKFAELAKKYSEDTTNNENGGALGYFGVGEMVYDFEKAARELEVGKYTTTPVVTSYGYHVILKTDQKSKPPLDKVKDKIIKNLAEELLALDSTMPDKALKKVCNGHSSINIEDNDLKTKYNSYLSDICLNANE